MLLSLSKKSKTCRFYWRLRIGNANYLSMSWEKVLESVVLNFVYRLLQFDKGNETAKHRSYFWISEWTVCFIT